jgi:hypothetical protein
MTACLSSGAGHQYGSCDADPPMPAGASDGGYAVSDFRDIDPRAGTVEDVRALVRIHAAARHAADARRGGQPHLRRARMGTARPHRRPRPIKISITVSQPRRARHVRGDHARDLPGDRTRQLHLGRDHGEVGDDGLQQLPVGPELRQSRRSSSRWSTSSSSGPIRGPTSSGWTRSPSFGKRSAPPPRTSARHT